MQGNLEKIYAIKLQTDGKILIGGSFYNSNGQSIGGLFRLNSDGSIDASFQNIMTEGTIRFIEILGDGRIIVAGGFSTLSRQSYTLARLNTDGSLDLTFSGSTFFTLSKLTVLSDGKIVFYSYGPEGANIFRRLNSDGSFDKNLPLTGYVSALRALPDGKLLVSGYTFYRINADGSRDATFNPGGSGFNSESAIFDIELTSDNKILIGGSFNSYNGISRSKIARLLSDGTLDTTFEPAANFAYVNDLAIQPDGKIIVGGKTAIAPPPVMPRGITRLNADGSVDNAFNTVLAFDSGNVRNAGKIVLQPDGKILVIGSYQASDGETRRGIVRLNTNGKIDTSFAPFTAISVFDFELQADGKIVVTGNSVAGSKVIFLVRINPDGSPDNSFKPPFNGDYGEIYGVTIQPDGKILLVGDWTPNDLIRRNSARLNADGSLDSTFTPGPFRVEFYKAIILPNGQFLVRGNTSFARFNANGTRDTTFNEGPSRVYDVAIQPDGKIIIGGEFEAYLIRLNPDGTRDTSFFAPLDYYVTAVKLQKDNKILIGGQFSKIGNVTRMRLARLHANGSVDLSFNPSDSFQTTINDIETQADDKILLSGGTFKIYNTVRFGVVRLFSSFTTTFDFDGDGKSDVSVYRPENGVWYMLNSLTGFGAIQFGIATDKLVPADYDGDGRTDVAVFRDGLWIINRSSAGHAALPFGFASDIPAPADFDGDGKAEIAVFRPSNGFWYTFNLTNSHYNAVQFGTAEDKPVAADYDGDGRADYAVYRPSNGVWYMLKSAQGFGAVQWGISTDKPVVGDYDGDGRADLAVYRLANGVWYLLQSSKGYSGIQFGIATDIPAPADYDGDGKTDVAIYRNGVLEQQMSTQGYKATQFGLVTDKPVSNAFVR